MAETVNSQGLIQENNLGVELSWEVWAKKFLAFRDRYNDLKLIQI